MNNNDTVFALSTPVGGAITVMRITGPGAREVLSAVFSGKIAHRRVSFGRITDPNGDTVDAVNAVFFEAPHSYTGEDMAEIYCHGSYAVAARLSELLSDTGLAVPAEAGEFTRRAYLNGKLDLAEAEAVMDLISASAERSRRAAVSQLSGRLSAVVSSLYERVKLLTAELANAMDDDTGEVGLSADFPLRAKELFKDLTALSESGMRSRVLREGARIALIGSPNVGKSSLLNALLMRERAIVTPIPGTTRDTLEESVSLDGVPATLIDTAGLREPSDEVERIGVGRTLAELDGADLVIWLVDGSRETSPDDEEIFSRLGGRRVLAAITKSDLDAVVLPDEGGRFRGFPAVRTSSVSGDGLELLKKTAAAMLLPDEAEEPIITNSRHISALSGAADRVSASSDLLKRGDTDAAYFELREAMGLIASVIGADDPQEELIDSVFSNFCIGK